MSSYNAAEPDTMAFLTKALIGFILSVADTVDVNEELKDRSKCQDILQASVIPAMTSFNVSSNTDVTSNKQGDDSCLYIVESGKLMEVPRWGARKVLEGGAIFGEKGLLYGVSKKTTITAVEHSKIWKLKRETFYNVILNHAYSGAERRIKMYSRVKEVSGLSAEKRDDLMRKLQFETFRRGTKLYQSCKVTVRLMLIESGKVEIEMPMQFDAIQDQDLLDDQLGIIRPYLRENKKYFGRRSLCDGDDSPAASAPFAFDMSKASELGLNKELLLSAMKSVNLRTQRGQRRRAPVKRIFELSDGAILGTGVLASKMSIEGSWLWRDELADGIPSIGAMSPITVTALSDEVKVSYFTVESFERLFGHAVTFNLFPSRHMINYYSSIYGDDAIKRFSEQVTSLASKVDSNVDGGDGKVNKDVSMSVSSAREEKDLMAAATTSLMADDEEEDEEEEEEEDDDDDDSVMTDDEDEEDKDDEKAVVANRFSFDVLENVTEVMTVPTGRIAVATKTECNEAGSHKKQHYVLKIFNKAALKESNRQESVDAEVKLLAELSHHPFIAKSFGGFHTPEEIVCVMERPMGGDLWSLIHEENPMRKRVFNGDPLIEGPLLDLSAVKFYVASIILALGYMHKRAIAYRNLQSENIRIDDKGYLRLTNMTNAKKIHVIGTRCMKTYTFCGSAEYMAPEMVEGIGHEKGADSWALGILLYEMLVGTTPFARYALLANKNSSGGGGDGGDDYSSAAKQERGEKNDQGEHMILSKIASFFEKQKVKFKIPESFKEEEATDGAMELVKRLLTLDPSRRPAMSVKEGSEIRDSAFFHFYDWRGLRDMKLSPPITPAELRKHRHIEHMNANRHPPRTDSSEVSKSRSVTSIAATANGTSKSGVEALAVAPAAGGLDAPVVTDVAMTGDNELLDDEEGAEWLEDEFASFGATSVTSADLMALINVDSAALGENVDEEKLLGLLRKRDAEMGELNFYFDSDDSSDEGDDSLSGGDYGANGPPKFPYKPRKMSFLDNKVIQSLSPLMKQILAGCRFSAIRIINAAKAKAEADKLYGKKNAAVEDGEALKSALGTGLADGKKRARQQSCALIANYSPIVQGAAASPTVSTSTIFGSATATYNSSSEDPKNLSDGGGSFSERKRASSIATIKRKASQSTQIIRRVNSISIGSSSSRASIKSQLTSTSTSSISSSDENTVVLKPISASSVSATSILKNTETIAPPSATATFNSSSEDPKNLPRGGGSFSEPRQRSSSIATIKRKDSQPTQIIRRGNSISMIGSSSSRRASIKSQLTSTSTSSITGSSSDENTVVLKPISVSVSVSSFFPTSPRGLLPPIYESRQTSPRNPSTVVGETHDAAPLPSPSSTGGYGGSFASSLGSYSYDSDPPFASTGTTLSSVEGSGPGTPRIGDASAASSPSAISFTIGSQGSEKSEKYRRRSSSESSHLTPRGQGHGLHLIKSVSPLTSSPLHAPPRLHGLPKIIEDSSQRDDLVAAAVYDRDIGVFDESGVSEQSPRRNEQGHSEKGKESTSHASLAKPSDEEKAVGASATTIIDEETRNAEEDNRDAKFVSDVQVSSTNKPVDNSNCKGSLDEMKVKIGLNMSHGQGQGQGTYSSRRVSQGSDVTTVLLSHRSPDSRTLNSRQGIHRHQAHSLPLLRTATTKESSAASPVPVHESPHLCPAANSLSKLFRSAGHSRKNSSLNLTATSSFSSTTSVLHIRGTPRNVSGGLSLSHDGRATIVEEPNDNGYVGNKITCTQQDHLKHLKALCSSTEEKKDVVLELEEGLTHDSKVSLPVHDHDHAGDGTHAATHAAGHEDLMSWSPQVVRESA